VGEGRGGRTGKSERGSDKGPHVSKTTRKRNVQEWRKLNKRLFIQKVKIDRICESQKKGEQKGKNTGKRRNERSRSSRGKNKE